MFTRARIKLTAIYLVIIMIISVLFNAVIFNGVSRELKARFVAIEERFEGRDIARQMRLHEVLIDDLQNAERSLLFILLYTDVLIFATSAIAGFVWAGKTLEPIKQALDEQKRFVADASHELRTPLTAIKTNIEVTLRDKKLTLKQAKKVLEQNLSEVDKMRDLASGLLTMARLSQYEEVTKDNINLAVLAKSVTESLMPLAKTKKIKIIKHFSEVHIQADQSSIEKVMRILLDNAIKYTPHGTIDFTVKRDKRNAFIKIKDTGIGISKDELPNIFERFYRADTSRTKSSVSGFGLGLSLAKQIVQSHNGRIEVASVIDQGTTFTVILPL